MFGKDTETIKKDLAWIEGNYLISFLLRFCDISISIYDIIHIQTEMSQNHIPLFSICTYLCRQKKMSFVSLTELNR